MTFGLTTAGMIVVGGMAVASAGSAAYSAKTAADKKKGDAEAAISAGQGAQNTSLGNIERLYVDGINLMNKQKRKTGVDLATVEAKYLAKTSSLMAAMKGGGGNMAGGQVMLNRYTDLAYNKKQDSKDTVIVGGEDMMAKIGANMYKHQRTAQSDMNAAQTQINAAIREIPTNVAMDVSLASVKGGISGAKSGLSLAGAMNDHGSFKGEMFTK